MRPVTLVLAAIALAAALAYAGAQSGWAGAVALLVLLAIGVAVSRARVRRGVSAGRFFGDGGEEETRLTGLGAGSPSETPVERDARSRTGPPAPPR